MLGQQEGEVQESSQRDVRVSGSVDHKQWWRWRRRLWGWGRFGVGTRSRIFWRFKWWDGQHSKIGMVWERNFVRGNGKLRRRKSNESLLSSSLFVSSRSEVIWTPQSLWVWMTDCVVLVLIVRFLLCYLWSGGWCQSLWCQRRSWAGKTTVSRIVWCETSYPYSFFVYLLSVCLSLSLCLSRLSLSVCLCLCLCLSVCLSLSLSLSLSPLSLSLSLIQFVISLELIRAEKEDEMFPDEIDTPLHIPARTRFAK